jgi:hypothetical protein
LENTFYLTEVFIHFHFCLQSLKCDTLSPKLSNCGNLTHLAYLFPKCPYHIFFKKKNPKKREKKKYKYAGVAGHHLWGGFLHFFLIFFFFKKKKKNVMGAFGNK